MTKENSKTTILRDHKRKGKKFIPPLMQFPTNIRTGYINNMLPELVWLGLLNEQYGYVSAARIMEKIFVNAKSVTDSTQHGNFALISTYKTLKENQKRLLAQKLQEDKVSVSLRNSIGSLTLLFDNCPLSFIGPPVHHYSETNLISNLSNCIGRVINKYETPGIVLNGSILLFRMATRTLRISSEVKAHNLNAVIDAPKSDEGKRAAAFIRAYTLGEFGMLNVDSSWARHFWNRCAILSPCEFDTEEVNDD